MYPTERNCFISTAENFGVYRSFEEKEVEEDGELTCILIYAHLRILGAEYTCVLKYS